MTPQLHTHLLAFAVLIALLFSGVILARNPQSWPARLNAIYGCCAAWWLFCMAMIASASDMEQVDGWARRVHLALGFLPGVMYHLNVLTADLRHRYQRRIVAHYLFSFALTLFCLTWPDLFQQPMTYAWGPFPVYTPWGLILPAALVFTLAEVILVYRERASRHPPGSPPHEKAKAFFHGNLFATLALVDFLPAYGFTVYPFGFVILTCLHIGTAFGSIRYRLIEITPQFAAERILTTMSDGLLVVDRSNQVRLTNAAVAELFGHSVEEMLNRRLDEVVDHHELLELLQGAEPKTAREVQFIDHHGENRFVRFYRSALVDQVGSRVADLWILHDLTAQRVAEAEKDELSGWVRETQKFQTLGVMAGGIAHDFNNILLAILGNAELISGKLDPNSPLQTQLAAIVTASQRATDLTSQLLTYAGHGTSLRTPIDLNPLVRELSELMRAAISKKIILTLDLAGDLPRVRGDSGQLSQVILNLISNASEAIGDQTGTIVVRTARSGGTCAEPPFLDGESETDPVLLEVRDSGAGMDAETRDKAFDPFFSTKLNGRGLGLATVLGIVRGHGGQIRVDSEPGRGSTFSIVLPGTNALAAPRNVEPVPQELVGGGVALVADDEAQIRDLLSHFLRDRGFDVIQAADGEQALSLFRDRSRDIKVVLLDVSMPGLGGFEVLQAIRVEAPSAPIVLMTGYSDVSQAALAPDSYCAFLGKPFLISQLSDAIRLAMAGDSGPSRRPMN